MKICKPIRTPGTALLSPLPDGVVLGSGHGSCALATRSRSRAMAQGTLPHVRHVAAAPFWSVGMSRFVEFPLRDSARPNVALGSPALDGPVITPASLPPPRCKRSL